MIRSFIRSFSSNKRKTCW